MKGTNSWSYRPYRPFFREVGDIYICRVVPSARAVRIEWLPTGAPSYSAFIRPRDGDSFVHAGDTSLDSFDFVGLEEGREYEFYVCAGEAKSRVRLARCGVSVGVTVNYLHPDDEAYAFSGRYLCSPSLIRHPDGYLLASMDLFAGDHPQNLTLIFRSDDDGRSWRYQCELMPCFWGKLFLHKGEVYMLACSTEYGDLLIGRSPDGGAHFDAPVVLLRGSGGRAGQSGVHKSPQNVIRYNGRVYTTVEWGTWANKDYGHAAMVASCREDLDLLCPENWRFTPPRRFACFDESLDGLPTNTMTIEGTLTTDPNGRLLNVMRFAQFRKAIVYAVDTRDPDAPLEFDSTIDFPGNYSKFIILRDEVSSSWYSVATVCYDPEKKGSRDLLALLRSKDLRRWETAAELLDFRGRDPKKIGFQYVDFFMEGEDILFLCRTALNGADSFHNTNYSTFHRIRRFRTDPVLE